MEVVYEVKGYLGNDYEFNDLPTWQGNIIMDNDNWIWGTASIAYNNEIKEVLMFGNLFPNKIIDFMMVGPNIVIGGTLIKTNNGFEGVSVTADFSNMTVSPNGTAKVILEEKYLGNEYIEYIKKKVYNMVDIDDYRAYLDFYNDFYDNRSRSKQELINVYSLSSGDVHTLVKTIF